MCKKTNAQSISNFNLPALLAAVAAFQLTDKLRLRPFGVADWPQSATPINSRPTEAPRFEPFGVND